MKHRLHYSLLLLLSMVFSLTSQAQTLIDGIYYDLDTETNTASVARNSNGSDYSGEIIIPCSVESEGIEYSVTTIGNNAFSNCTSLTSIEIPSSVTYIGLEVFGDCTSLTSVVCEAVTPPTCDSDVFGGVPLETAKLYVPEASIGAYRTTSPWSTFASILPLSDFDTKIDAVEETADRGASAHAVYSLSGQRTVLPGRGIYITNGKALIAK